VSSDPDTLAVEELEEAVEHIDRVRSRSGATPGRWADRKLSEATQTLELVAERRFGETIDTEDDS
jgi:hypothetical protein